MQTSGPFGVPAQDEAPQFLSRVQAHIFNLSTAADMGALSSPSASTQVQHLHKQPIQSAHQAGVQSQQHQSIGFAHDHLSHTQQHVNSFTAGHHQQQLHQNHSLLHQNQNGFTAGPINSLQLESDEGQLHQLHQSMLQTNSSFQAFSAPDTSHSELTPTNVTTATHNTSPNLVPKANPSANPRSRFSQSSVVGTTIKEESYDDQIDEQDMEDEDLEQKGGSNVRDSELGAARGEAAAAQLTAAGARWPRQETLALLKVRADMDAQFRDYSLKGPLWEEVSRKLAAMGYHRSARKCKEKFENVHKYYKRTRDGKVGRQDGKGYRFFSQLEALYGKTITTIADHSPTVVANKTPPLDIVPLQRQGAATNLYDVRATSFAGFDAGHAVPLAQIRQGELPLSARQQPNMGVGSPKQLSWDSEPSTSGIDLSSDTSGYDDDNEFDDDDDDEDDGDGDDDHHTGCIGAHGSAQDASGAGNSSSERRKRKHKASSVPKKYLAFFESAMKKVLQKQEEMHQKFLEALEKRETDRMIREEAWKRQEMARLSREHELWTQERALAASRDATLVTFLQKVTGHSLQLPEVTCFQVPTVATAQPPAVSPQLTTCVSPFDSLKEDYSHHADKESQMYDPNSKRWPKPEVLALIKLRTDFDQKFHDSGSKSQLWEEISAAMVAQGFNRPAKRCKEKWENINKYFKKAKESNKKRPEDSKTCPYYHYLDALYKEGLLGCSPSKQVLSDKGEDQSGSTTVGITASTAQEDVVKVVQVQEVQSQALASVNVQASQGDKTIGVSSGLPSLVSSDISGKKILTGESSGMATTSMPHPLERVSSSKSLPFGSSKPEEQPQLNNVQFGSIM